MSERKKNKKSLCVLGFRVSEAGYAIPAGPWYATIHYFMILFRPFIVVLLIYLFLPKLKRHSFSHSEIHVGFHVIIDTHKRFVSAGFNFV